MREMVQTTSPANVEASKAGAGFSLGSIALMLAIVVVAAIIGLALLRQNQGRPLDGPAPKFAFTTFEGVSYNLEDFRGQVVVLNFWASWCVGCLEEAPDLQSTWEKYKDQGVVFLGIAYADNGPSSLAFLERYGISYMNAPDLGSVIYDMYQVVALPETFIINQNGDVIRLFIDRVSEAQLSPVIDGLLAGGS